MNLGFQMIQCLLEFRRFLVFRCFRLDQLDLVNRLLLGRQCFLQGQVIRVILLVLMVLEDQEFQPLDFRQDQLLLEDLGIQLVQVILAVHLSLPVLCHLKLLGCLKVLQPLVILHFQRDQCPPDFLLDPAGQEALEVPHFH